ncbi:YdeI/OmpD-associated family protein [Oerskovia sp. NPDC060287]|uniref:YdeI/OmpD-associated family protein n=1 Tax=Oerskovia sp. NPDC060287 TaxID=3347095 RepID=UPI00364F7762
MRFRTTILQSGKTATGLPVPDDVVTALGAGKRVPVRVTLGGHTYRSSVAPYQGRFMIALSAENRVAARVSGGDEVDVEIEVDDAPREVTVPDDLAAALTAEARAAFDGLSFSRRRALVEPIEAAKTPETRQRRIDRAVADLAPGG